MYANWAFNSDIKKSDGYGCQIGGMAKNCQKTAPILTKSVSWYQPLF
jgi:hypothetical protein